MRKEPDGPNTLRRGIRALVLLVLIAGVPFAFIAGCQSKLLYYPRPYAAGTTDEWREKTAGKPVDFTTSQGNQRAFLQGNCATSTIDPPGSA